MQRITVNDRVLTEDYYRGDVVQMRDDLTALMGTTFAVSNYKYLKDLVFTYQPWFGIRRLVSPDTVTWYPAGALVLAEPDSRDLVST